MIGELERIAGQCDGVRCDMAMLVLPEVFARTWGIAAQPFWPTATHEHPAIGQWAFMQSLWDRFQQILMLSSQLFLCNHDPENFFYLLDVLEDSFPPLPLEGCGNFSHLKHHTSFDGFLP